MALRASASEVQAVLADTSADVTYQLLMANQMVDDVLLGASLSATALKHIEIYLACHIYEQATPSAIRESYDKASFQYANAVGPHDRGLSSTRWGQMAQTLDTSGTLRALDRKKVDMHVL